MIQIYLFINFCVKCVKNGCKAGVYARGRGKRGEKVYEHHRNTGAAEASDAEKPRRPLSRPQLPRGRRGQDDRGGVRDVRRARTGRRRHHHHGALLRRSARARERHAGEYLR